MVAGARKTNWRHDSPPRSAGTWSRTATKDRTCQCRKVTGLREGSSMEAATAPTSPACKFVRRRFASLHLQTALGHLDSVPRASYHNSQALGGKQTRHQGLHCGQLSGRYVNHMGPQAALPRCPSVTDPGSPGSPQTPYWTVSTVNVGCRGGGRDHLVHGSLSS